MPSMQVEAVFLTTPRLFNLRVCLEIRIDIRRMYPSLSATIRAAPRPRVLTLFCVVLVGATCR